MKHNLSVQISRITEMKNEAIDDNEDYAVDCLNAVLRQLRMTEEELEQLEHEDSETIDYLWTDINYKKYIKIDEVLG